MVLFVLVIGFVNVCVGYGLAVCFGYGPPGLSATWIALMSEPIAEVAVPSCGPVEGLPQQVGTRPPTSSDGLEPQSADPLGTRE